MTHGINIKYQSLIKDDLIKMLKDNIEYKWNSFRFRFNINVSHEVREFINYNWVDDLNLKYLVWPIKESLTKKF